MKLTTINLHLCRGCNLPAQSIEKIEILPGGGVALKAIHENGVEHRWEEYGSIWDYIKPKHKYIKCPRCGLSGSPKQDHIRLRYFVDHVFIIIGGTWGKNQQRKYKQCCMRKGPEVDLYLKLTGNRR